MGHLSLRSNIYVGFAVILGLLIANGLVSYFGLLRLRETLAGREAIDGANATVLKIDRDVQELRLRVDRYITNGHASLRDEVESINQRLRDRVQSVQNQSLDQRMSDLFGRVGSHIEAYKNQFAAVVEERRVREDLVEVQLPQLSQTVRSALDALAASLKKEEATAENRLALTECKAFFSQAEKSFLRYFATPSTQYANTAVARLEDAIQSLALLSDRGQHAAAVAVIEEYERTGLRAVQATRSYLYLRNVVMAAEASEVVHYSKTLRKIAEVRSEEIAADAVLTSERVNRVTGATIGLASLLAALIAGRLAYLTIPPLTALTEAFTRLSRGETLSDIPGTDRRDEIGAMAQAARVFSDRNHQTQELLTQSETMRRELQVKAEELAATNSELDNFAYIASHDLKSPLRGIRQLASWIEEDAADKLEPASLEHLQHMQSRVTKMESLLSGLLEYSRVGKTSLQAELVDVDQMIATIVDFTDNPDHVQLRRPAKLPTFPTLRTPLEQVLMNLIGNAIKYNHKGSEGIVELDWDTRDDFHHVVVRDNGPGIHSKDCERVFQMYQRVGDLEVEGSGMGLALVKKQIEQVGGEVKLESTLGEGCRFKFTWPTQITKNLTDPA